MLKKHVGISLILIALALPPGASAGSITVGGSVAARPALTAFAGSDYDLVFGWAALTRSQVDDFLANTRVTVTLDGAPLEASSAEIDPSGTIVRFHYPHRPLAVGTHTIVTSVEFVAPVFDGFETYTGTSEATRALVVRPRGATTVSGAGRIWSDDGPSFGVDVAMNWKGSITGVLTFGWSGFLTGTARATCVATRGDAAVVVGRLATPVEYAGLVWQYAGVFVAPHVGTAFVAFGPDVCAGLFDFGSSNAQPLVDGDFSVHAP